MTRWALAAACVTASFGPFVGPFVEGACAAEITAWSVDAPAFSPNGDGVADSVTVTMTYESTAATLDSLWIVLVGDEVELPLYFDTDVPVTGSFTFTWGGEDLDGGAVPDTTYAVSGRAADGDGVDSASVAITIDTVGPAFTSAQITGPEGGLANGDFLQLRTLLSEPADSLWLDVSALDDDTSNYDSQFFDEISAGDYSVLYRISDANTTNDQAGIAIGLSARDSLGNEATYAGTDLTVCLSNAPPIVDGIALFNPSAADTLAPGFAYTSGDTITVLACFYAPFDSLAQNSFTYLADFSGVDTEFSPFLNPATLDSETVFPVPDSLQIGEQYPGTACVQFSYVLSEENATPEGVYDIAITAMDGGCGSATATVLASIAELGPETPSLDFVDSESVSSPTFTVTGVAMGAFRVEVLDADTDEVRAEATPDSMSGVFAADVVLREGPNRFVAVAYDEFLHASRASNVIEVVLTAGFRVSMPDRFFPGDGVEVSALTAASRYDLDIFNLAGDRVHRDTVADPGEVHAFTWNGRNRAGRTVGTGPYVARITRHTSSGKDVITRAFVFTRK